jgi:hypothetical protein
MRRHSIQELGARRARDAKPTGVDMPRARGARRDRQGLLAAGSATPSRRAPERIGLLQRPLEAQRSVSPIMTAFGRPAAKPGPSAWDLLSPSVRRQTEARPG